MNARVPLLAEAPSLHSRHARLRSVASARPYFLAVGFCFLHYLAVTVSATMVVFCMMTPSKSGALFVFTGMIVSLITWIFAFLQRREPRCSLCKGTPLADSGARAHLNAWRLKPLNHGTTAVLSIMVCQKYRCMYCGEGFDLLKDSTSGYFDNTGRR